MKSMLLILLGGCAAGTSVMGDEPDREHEDGVPIAGTLPPSTATIEDVIAWLDAELPARSPGTEMSITWEDLDTGQRVSLRGDTKHVSASSAKAWWVAAALDGVGIAPIMPYAVPIFRDSDNSATGSVIDLIGPNAVNVWTWNVAGMSDSAFTQWNYDKTRVASNSPRVMGTDNYATSDDAVTFLGRVYRDEILVGATGDQLLAWMTLSPREGIAARLPADVRETVMRKAGWLPPGCCMNSYNTSNDVGIVVTPHGRAFAVAIFARHGTDYYAKQLPFIDLSGCVLYRAFTQDDTLTCE